MSGSPISGTVTGNVEVNFIYSLDDNNNGTPDKYEVTITYLVVNGYFNDTETLTEVKKDYVLAEKQADGTWNETTKYLVDIPTPTAKTGYNTTGTWEPETPTDRTEVTKDETYVFTYGAEAVSYTHLDVYKRQLLCCELLDGKSHPLEADDTDANEAIRQIFAQMLRRQDLYTRYSPSQYLVLLNGMDQYEAAHLGVEIEAAYRKNRKDRCV